MQEGSVYKYKFSGKKREAGIQQWQINAKYVKHNKKRVIAKFAIQNKLGKKQREMHTTCRTSSEAYQIKVHRYMASV